MKKILKQNQSIQIQLKENTFNYYGSAEETSDESESNQSNQSNQTYPSNADEKILN